MLRELNSYSHKKYSYTSMQLRHEYGVKNHEHEILHVSNDFESQTSCLYLTIFMSPSPITSIRVNTTLSTMYHDGVTKYENIMERFDNLRYFLRTCWVYNVSRL